MRVIGFGRWRHDYLYNRGQVKVKPGVAGRCLEFKTLSVAGVLCAASKLDRAMRADVTLVLWLRIASHYPCVASCSNL